MTSPPSPGMRIVSPRMSLMPLISLLNQPSIWTPVLPAGNWITLKRSA
jgi:hypothetical protein